MIYFMDQFGRYTGESEDRNINFYNELGFIPRHITDVKPLPEKPGFEIVFKGDKWVYWPMATNTKDEPQ